MGSLGLFLVIVGSIYLFYSIICRKKVTIYNKTRKMQIVNMDKFISVQLNFAIVNSLFMIVIGLLVWIYKLNDLYALYTVVLFHVINYIFRFFAQKKGYVIYKYNK